MKTTDARAARNEDCDHRKIYRPRPPFHTLKCLGPALFRDRYARDYACILDFDPDVISWKCVPEAIVNDSGAANARWWHVDFVVEATSERLLVEVWQTTTGGPSWLPKVAERMGCRHQPVSIQAVDQIRLQNAKDLLHYAGSEVPLGDRIRVLAALDEMGTLTLAECLSVVREGRAMHSIASLILSGILDVDLSEALLGPDTVVRRGSK